MPSGRASSVQGFAALPTLHRATRDGQYLFVNGRPVRDKLLSAAVWAGYMDHVPRDRFPVVALVRRVRAALRRRQRSSGQGGGALP